MSLHRSLKTKPAALNQHRNVLTRAERVARREARGVFDPATDSPLHMPKEASRKVAIKKKVKKKTEDE